MTALGLLLASFAIAQVDNELAIEATASFTEEQVSKGVEIIVKEVRKLYK